MYTVDASVWVNGFDQREPGHAESRQALDLLSERRLPIVVPHLVLVEVAGAVSRTRQIPDQARAFALALRQLPNVTFMAFNESLAMQALELAAQHGLRGADAVYAAVALQAGCKLLTLDNEHLTRLPRIVAVLTPAEALRDLASSQSGGRH